MADRFGRKPVPAASLCVALLGLLLTLAAPLAMIIGGLSLFTVGFFAGHAVASGSVGRLAQGAKGHAASLYLLSYYLGSSLLSLAGGLLWEQGGWPAVATFCAALLLLAVLFAVLPARPLPETSPRRRLLAALPLLAPLLTTAGPAQARTIPSPFLQQMLRAELPNPSPPPDGMAPLSALRIAGAPVLLGKTPIDTVGRRLGIGIEHQSDSGDSIYWLCVRLDVPAGSSHPPRDRSALSLWLISDAVAAGPSRAISAIALDTVGREGRGCPVPSRDVDLTLDARIAPPGATAAAVAALYGHAPTAGGRSAYSLPGMQPDPGLLTLTIAMRNNHVEAIWLADTPDN